MYIVANGLAFLRRHNRLLRLVDICLEDLSRAESRLNQ